MRRFAHVLTNTLIANVTTSFLWFALTFWVYLETRSLLATGVIGGAYMLLVAVFGMVFGTIVDRHRKKQVMLYSSLATLGAFVFAGGLFLAVPEAEVLSLGGPWFWVFSGVILAGAVVENLRNIALSTTVTLLVPVDRHANANGLVGAVQGIGFLVTSVFSGLAIGFLGMGPTLLIAIVVTAAALVHLAFVHIPEERPKAPAKAQLIDFRGSAAAIRVVPGLFALIIFSTFNNFIGGVYMALMDPYGIEMFGVQLWGLVLGVCSCGFIIGGVVISRTGLGTNPIRTLLLAVAAMGLLGAVFALREWWWLYAVGILAYMALVPIVEAAEQTVIQRVVPFETQGRVFGAAQALESAAAPITAFLIAPLAEFVIVPAIDSPAGAEQWGWLLGEGRMRGIAFVFLLAGAIMIVVAGLAFLSRSYKRVSAEFAARPVGAVEGRAVKGDAVVGDTPVEGDSVVRDTPVTADDVDPVRSRTTERGSP
ncbi:MFS transporter [Microbacteriaceae bacterium VKM Ac-2855]|nr:MFS transporter [Microbacteriaceae bacterium VKM Ac-2855]